MFRALLSLAFTAMLVELAMAANYTVGGTNGWDLTSNLQSWAAAQSFYVGDNLIFQYSQPHDVLEVTKADYDSCQATSALQTYTDGNTVITLTTPGKRYFTCGVTGHCTQGMKLQVDTLATSAATPQSPSPSPSPATATSPSISPNVASPPLPELSTPPSPAIATPPSPGTATLAPFSPPSSAPVGSVPNALSPIIPSAETPVLAPTATANTILPPPSLSSANRGHLLSKLLFIGICFGTMMLQGF